MNNALAAANWFKSSYSNDQGGACVEAARLDVTWFKSSYSNGQGGECVEAAHLDAEWFKSSHSNDHGGECVEGARMPDGAMAVRDSKVPDGPALLFPAAAWTAFAWAVREGTFVAG
ncbi:MULTISPECIES: DUF397 domain-containing protein [unclassified Streptomyces]|uniref:DUF397 domain-containing protein n=1 Tax=unclassified Streptomyces TaxID=2593676 RepID=UPI002E29B438|nr:DUF397 domain-containing protein [Streptomyces sp. NBC_00223]